jgi:cytochrome P450
MTETELPATASGYREEIPVRIFARLNSPEGLADPYPHLHALRAVAPVYKLGQVYFLTRYADCHRVLNDTSLPVQDPRWYDDNMPGWRDNMATRLMYQSMQSRNNPDHARLRKLVGGAFSPRRMAGYQSLVDRLAPAMFDRMADAGRDGAPIDFMEYLAYPLPSAVMGEMLGVPEADRERFREIGADFFNVLDLGPDSAAVARAHASATAMLEYWQGVVADRRRRPRADLTTDLTEAHAAGLLTEEELLGLLLFLFSAGFRTTTALLGNATAQLLADQAGAQSLRRDPSLAGAVVEESLRHEAPSQLVPRQTSADCVIGGQEIPEGRLLIAVVGAANRDPAQYHEPDRFIAGRFAQSGGRALSFGGGMHYCIGAALSRMEATAVLPLLLNRFPRLELAGEPVRRLALRMRLHTKLPVSLHG